MPVPRWPVGALFALCLIAGCAAESTTRPAPSPAVDPAGAVLPDDGPAPDYDAVIDRKVAEIKDDIIQVRRKIHANPELGNREVQTAKLVAERLRSLGLEVKTGVAKTGVVALLKGGRPGPVVAVRADMDALPVIEATGLPFASQVVTIKPGTEDRVGVMHACGHDIHTACLVGTATVLAGMRDRIPGTIKFLFQPAEEGPPAGEEGGALLMMKEGVLADPAPTAAFALHCDPELAAGELGYTPGPMLAAVDHFKIRIIGRGGHGSAPWRANDPVIIAAQAVTALQAIHSRQIDTRSPAVISVTQIRGGTRWNIIPDEVALEGTIRTHHDATRKLIHERIKRTLDGVTAAFGGRAELEIIDYGPALVNDAATTNYAARGMARAAGRDRTLLKAATMGGEDFSYIAEKVPSCYYRLGTRRPDEPAEGTPSLHSNRFNPDERCIELGMRSMCRVLMDALERGAKK